MISDFPRAYRVVRQGQWQTASVSNLAELVELRTELEIIQRFGAGATAGLVAAVDARMTQAWTNDRIGPDERTELIQNLQEIKGILCDAMTPANAKVIAEIDQGYPEIRTRLPMKSIEKDTQQFRKDVTEQVKASDADVDAMLAAFEQTTDQADVADIPVVPGVADDAMVEALLAEATQATDPTDVDDPTASVEAALIDPVETAMAELISSPNASESNMADDDPASGIQAVSEQVAETLTNTEQQLNAIASAFETAAAELGQMTTEVQQVTQTPPAMPQEVSPEPNNQCGPVEDEPAFDATPMNDADEPSLPSPTTGRPTASIKANLQQARARILSELDDVLAQLERVDQMQAQADETLQRAKNFERAAAQAQQAGQCLAEAEAEAAKARAIFDQAQTRVSSARQSWEQARQEAAAAAASANPC